MKYLFAGLVIPTLQMLFLIAFALFAMSLGVATLASKFKSRKISD